MRFLSAAPAFGILGFVLVLALAGPAAPVSARPHATATPVPTPVPAEDPAVTAIAHREFVSWQIGVVNKSRYTADLAAQITDDKVKQSSAALAALGTFERSEYLGPAMVADAQPGEDVHGYVYRMVCSEGAVYMNLALSGPDNKVAFIGFRDKLHDETEATPVPTPH
ncbi:MAG: hypothetical protein ACLQPV_05720 [Vulcanimicrobiaceae bacterium]